MQLASNAILNAIWDLWAKVEGKPLWRLVADFTPEQLVSVIDFRYITDALSKEEALSMLRETAKTKQERLDLALKNQVSSSHGSGISIADGSGGTRLQHQCWMVGPFRRRSRGRIEEGRGRRIPSFQAQGRTGTGCRPKALGDGAKNCW